MKAVIQRVRDAQVDVAGQVVGSIAAGLLVYVGVAVGDEVATAEKFADKVANLRIFQDPQGKMNLSVQDAAGGIMAVPNFTLLADAGKGRRPAFAGAAEPQVAKEIFAAFVAALKKANCPVASGVFGASMIVRSSADGPVNILLEIG